MHQFIHDERGATAIEYALIASIISVVCIGAVTFLGQNLSAVFNTLSTSVAAN